MKLAILADIHANFPACTTVCQHVLNWKPDSVVVAGDIINRGPRPVECLETLLKLQHERGWILMRGNHEDYVIAQSSPDAPKSGVEAEVHQPSAWTASKLGRYIDIIKTLPERFDLNLPGETDIRIVHASMKGNRVGIYPETSAEELAGLIENLESHQNIPSLFGVGHTHRPLIRRNHHTIVVNAGSAGLPFDGNYRPSYVQATWEDQIWKITIPRLDYDYSHAKKDFFSSGYYTEAGPLVKLVLKELKFARSQLYGWAERYQGKVLSGSITLAESVQRYMQLSV